MYDRYYLVPTEIAGLQHDRHSGRKLAVKASKPNTRAVPLGAPMLASAAGLEGAASGMAQDAAKSAAKDAARSMVPNEVSRGS